MNVKHKYAPQSLADVIYPSAAVQQRINAYASKALEGNVLLWGPNGTGKSTVARLLPQAIDGVNATIENKDISDLMKMADLKSYLSNATYWASGNNDEKLFIVAEEFDSVKGDFAKFWTAIDKFQDRIMLIITTNELMSIHKSIRSRCDQIQFPAVKAQHVLPRAQAILKAEGVNLPDYQVLSYLAEVENFGDVRLYMNKLNEVIYLHRSHQPLPPASGAVPAVRRTFTVVQGSKQLPNNASV